MTASRQGADLSGQGQQRLFVLAAEVRIRLCASVRSTCLRAASKGGVPVELIDQRVAQRVQTSIVFHGFSCPR